VGAGGFVGGTGDGSVVACSCVDTFAGAPLSAGTHYVLVERAGGALTVRQPVGDDTDLALAWTGGSARVQALSADGSALGDVAAEVTDGRVRFHYAGEHGGHAVAAYRVTSSAG